MSAFQELEYQFVQVLPGLSCYRLHYHGRHSQKSILKCVDEGIRMRLENAVLPREITDFNVEQLIEKTQMFFQRKCNAIIE